MLPASSADISAYLCPVWQPLNKATKTTPKATTQWFAVFLNCSIMILILRFNAVALRGFSRASRRTGSHRLTVRVLRVIIIVVVAAIVIVTLVLRHIDVVQNDTK